MNQQPPEPSAQATTDDYLDVHSIFLTLQGEGPFSGRRAVFLRLAGCNLQCPGCDTLYTEGRQRLHVDEVVRRIHDVGLRAGTMPIIVITGGEPLRQSLGSLVLSLVRRGATVQIESNGTMPPGKQLEVALRYHSKNIMLVVSPKTRNIHPECYQHATVFKYVLDHRHVGADGLPDVALEHERGKGVARPRPGAPVYVTPYDAQDEDENALNLRAVVDSCLDHGYVAGLQIHKYLCVP